MPYSCVDFLENDLNNKLSTVILLSRDEKKNGLKCRCMPVDFFWYVGKANKHWLL